MFGKGCNRGNSNKIEKRALSGVADIPVRNKYASSTEYSVTPSVQSNE